VTVDPVVQRFLDSLAVGAGRRTADLTVAERRASLARLLELGGEPPPIGAVLERRTEGAVGPLRLRCYAPRAEVAQPLPGLIYFHGGGWVAGSLETHDGICRRLAHASGCHVMSVDYRLAPEARFPAALEDACAATRWILAEACALGVDPRRIGVGGDSAGGTLAAAVCQARAAAGEGGLAVQVLLCPILDYRAETASRRAFADGYLLDRSTLEDDLVHLLGSADVAGDPRLFPLRTEALRGLPPACIHTAECDPLRDEAALYAERLRAADVHVRYRCHPGMIHLFYGLGALIPGVGEAYGALGTDIRALFDRAVP